jgi:L-rhamnose isomerase
MIDQSHNVTDPIESLILSSNEIVNCYAKSLLVNYNVLEEYQNKDDAIKAEFSHVRTSTLSRLNNYLKSKKVRFNINMKNSKVYLEMIL